MSYRVLRAADWGSLESQVNEHIAQGYELTPHGIQHFVLHGVEYIVREMVLVPVVAPSTTPPPPISLSSDTKQFLQSLVLAVNVSNPGVKEIRVVNTLQNPVYTDEKQGNP